MMPELDDAIALASKAIAIDTRSSRSNRALADLLEAELVGFEVERLDFMDAEGVAKSALVAYRQGSGGEFVALCAHMDTVPPVGWDRDPFSARLEGGRLYGLGSCDMKGPMAAVVVSARGLPADRPAMLILTCDEETTKAGARRIVAQSRLLRTHQPWGIVVAEPTGLVPLRGHRADVQFLATAKGVQAHSSAAEGVNANISLIPFLSDMRALHLQLRADTRIQDPNYEPPWCDLNIIIDNHGAPLNVTPGLATCRMKFRYSKSIDPDWVIGRVHDSAIRHGLELSVRPEGTPPELPAGHPLVRLVAEASGTAPEVGAFGTDASQFSPLAPTVIFGPGSMRQAHRPEEYIDVGQIGRAMAVYRALAGSGGRH